MTYDSSGPDGRIRGNANQIYEKYLTLGRDANSAGDRISAEAYYQHAEHYFRILNESMDSRPDSNGFARRGPRPQGGDGAQGAAPEAPVQAAPRDDARQQGASAGSPETRQQGAGEVAQQNASGDGKAGGGAVQAGDVAAANVSAGEAGRSNGAEPPGPRRRRGRPAKARTEQDDESSSSDSSATDEADKPSITV